MPSAAGDPEAPCVLVTGAQGFVGSRLVRRLGEAFPGWRLDTPAKDPVDGAPGLDIADAAAVERWIAERPPAVVVHLAALAAVTASLDNPRLAWDVNLGGTLNLVLALKAHAPSAFLLFVSSAEVYGASLNSPEPCDETRLLQPVNPYAASKAAADILVRQAARAGQPAAVARAFNHIGAGQAEAFVAPSFAAQIARAEAGLAPPVLRVGSLEEERDFLDVEDVVGAYLAMLQARGQLQPGEVFNVASGVAVRIGDILDRLRSMARIPITVEVDSARLRPVSVPRVVGDASRLRARLGWRPQVGLERTLSEILAHQRAMVAAG